MRIRLCCVLTLLVMGRIGFAQVGPLQLIGRAVEDATDEKYKSIGEAIGLFYRGDVVGAGRMLDDAKRANPELPPGAVMLAQLYFAGNQINQVRAQLENAVTNDPSDPEAYLLFGDLALREGRTTDAEALFTRGMTLCQRLTGNEFRQTSLTLSGYSGLAAAAARRGQWAVVERNTRSWLELDPNSVPARSQLGRALFFLNKPQSAYKEFQTLHKANPMTPLAEINMALLYEELVAQGDVAKRASASNAMRKAEEVDAENPLTRLAVARWAVDACELEMAERNAKAALEIDGKSLDAKLLVGVIARHRKQWAEAEAMFRDLHLLAPANFEVLRHLALVLAEQQDPAKQQLALSYAELGFRANSDLTGPMGREAAVTLAWVFFKLRRQADAFGTAQNALRAGDIGDESTYMVARIVSDAGQPELGLRLLQPVLAKKQCFAFREDAERLLRQLKSTE